MPRPEEQPSDPALADDSAVMAPAVPAVLPPPAVTVGGPAEGSEGVPGGARAAARASEPLWTGRFVLLMLVNLLFFFGFQLVVITAPLLAVDLGGGNASAGLVLGAFTVAAMIVRPVTGWALDAYGRRALFLIGIVVTLAAILAHELVAGVFFLLALRFMHGAGFGVTTTASGTIASDLVPRTRLGEGMGYYSVTMSLSMAVAPSVGLTLAGAGDFTALFLLAGGLTAVSLALAGTLKIPRREHTGVRMGLWSLVERTSLFPASMIFLLTTTYGPLVAFIALYGRDRGIANVGPYFTVYAIVLLFSRPVSGRIADRYGYERTAAVGIASAAAGLVVLALAHSMPWFLVSALVYGLGFGTAQPSLQALVIHRVPPERRGAANATFFTAFDLGVAAGSVIGGFLAGLVALSGVYLVSAGVAAAAAVCLVVFMSRRAPTVARLE